MIELNKIYNEDCLETLARMPDNFVDLIITSPTYEDVSGAGYSAKSKDVLFLKLYSDFLEKLFSEYGRVLSDRGQIYFNIKSKTFNKTLRTPHWIEFLNSFQQLKIKSYIIWKYSGSFDSTNKRFHLDYEIIYHLSKTDNIYLNEKCGIKDALSSVWYIPHNIPIIDRIHPTQKPIKLYDWLLINYAKEGDKFLDTHLGSGSSRIAAYKHKLNFVGFEIDKDYFDAQERRFNIFKSQLTLF